MHEKHQDNEIQRHGRWRSSDFVRYCHLGRHNRWKDKLELSQSVPEMNTMVNQYTFNTCYVIC